MIRTDNHVHPTPAVVRAIEKVVKSVKEAGHEVVEWTPLEHNAMDKMLDKFFTADGGKFVANAKQGEPFFRYMEAYGKAKEMGVSELWSLHEARQKIVQRYHQMWNESGKLTSNGRLVDGLIVPAGPVGSCPIHNYSYVGYTSVFNCLNYPSVVVPVLRSDKSLDQLTDRNGISKKHQRVLNDYNDETYHDGLVGVQVITRSYEDEKALELAKIVVSALNAA